VTRRHGRRRKQIMDDLKDMRVYWKLKAEALCRPLWRNRVVRSYGPVVRDKFSLFVRPDFSRKVNTFN
jgi:hypothetical protein